MKKCPKCGEELNTESLLEGLVAIVVSALKFWLVWMLVIGIIVFILIGVSVMFEEEQKPSSPFLQLFQGE